MNVPAAAVRWVTEKAKQVASTFGYSEWEDLTQSVWLALLSTKRGQQGWWLDVDPETGETDFDFEGFRSWAAGRMTKQAMRDRKAIMGDVEDDELRYSRKEITYLLPYMWDRTPLAVRGEDGPVVSHSVDHSKGPDLPAKLVDLAVAYAETVEGGSQADRLLFLIFAADRTHEEAADEIGVPRGSVAGILDRTLKSIARALNHTSWGRTYSSPDEWNDGPGSRRAMSNAEAADKTGY